MTHPEQLDRLRAGYQRYYGARLFAEVVGDPPPTTKDQARRGDPGGIPYVLDKPATGPRSEIRAGSLQEVIFKTAFNKAAKIDEIAAAINKFKREKGRKGGVYSRSNMFGLIAYQFNPKGYGVRRDLEQGTITIY